MTDLCNYESNEPGTLLCVRRLGHDGDHETPSYVAPVERFTRLFLERVDDGEQETWEAWIGRDERSPAFEDGGRLVGSGSSPQIAVRDLARQQVAEAGEEAGR